ncbi:MAG: nitronate monooxygenase [Burkholderiaceae bacterium]|nr:nitronate monooxygenase [Burkholderiaceae bacterium]
MSKMNPKAHFLLRTFGITKPIFAMPSTLTATVKQVAEACNAGALGVFPAGYLTADEIEKVIVSIRQLTDKPFALQIFPEQPVQYDDKTLQVLDKALSSVREHYGISPQRPLVPIDFEKQFEAILDLNVPVVGLMLGGLREPYMEALEAKGIKTFGVTSNLKDAKVLRASGVNAVLAHGWDGPGLVSHNETEANRAFVGAMTLIEECVRAIQVPVLAGGSMMSQGAVKVAKTLGAAGLVLTDALLAAEESALPKEWISALAYMTDGSSQVSNSIFGRNARVLWTGLCAEMQQAGLPSLPFPYQWLALEDIFRAAMQGDIIEDCPLEFGQMGYLLTADKTQDIIDRFCQWYEE